MKACAIACVLLLGAFLGNGLGTAENLGFLVFLIGCILTLRTREYLQNVEAAMEEREI